MIDDTNSKTRQELLKIQEHLTGYRADVYDFNITDYYTISELPLLEVAKYFKSQDMKDAEKGVRSFLTSNRQGLKEVKYEQLKKLKIIRNGIEINEEVVDIIKNKIEIEGYPHLVGIYNIIRNKYLNGENIEDFSRAEVEKRIENKEYIDYELLEKKEKQKARIRTLK